MNQQPGIEAPQADRVARERLARAAIRLFTTKGFAATSVREIVAEAGVARPVLYYHFRSKEGIYLDVLGEAEREFRSLLDAGMPDDEPAADQLRRYLAEMHAFARRRLDLLRLMHSILYGPPQGAPFFDFHSIHDSLLDAIRRIVRRGIERGEFLGDEDGMVLGVLGVFNIVTEMDLIHPDRSPGPEGLERALTVVFRGMASDRLREAV